MRNRRSGEHKNAAVGSGRERRIIDRRGFSLAELIAAIALLSVFGVIVARMFFLSDGLSRKTEQFDKSVMLAANIAEAWQATSEQGTTATFSASTSLAGFNPQEFLTEPVSENKWIGLLDDKLRPTGLEQGSIRLTVRQERAAVKDVWQLVILIEEIDKDSDDPENASGEMIYELAASGYITQEVLE